VRARSIGEEAPMRTLFLFALTACSSMSAYRPMPTSESSAELRERPGLGTTWGETRSSPVHEVVFYRAADEPFSVGAVYYNDRTGVEAMESYDGSHRDEPLAFAGGLSVSIVDEAGAPLPALAADGRIYIIGEAGRRYGVVVHNRTDRRYEAVVSVDGLDVIDGRPASTRKRGYLIDPWGSLVVDGFRQNQAEVAAFRFGSVAASYAANTSGDRNVGVIGFAFFGERGVAPWSDNELERRRNAQPFGSFAQPVL
jgi:hypothetical protein